MRHPTIGLSGKHQTIYKHYLGILENITLSLSLLFVLFLFGKLDSKQLKASHPRS
ncbi:hypothetical protein H359_0997 [Chlamydia ibidis 10-1398/6]|uniref:Uncharacterized protein n=1 Tax=Chlamydia ibidis 10-1398/6 TaxID=1046581 RepID=A0ABP2XCV9_9CHLA|nr:hypothetical protein H359_0997 [Chlamydia ibidis 10-1398/6]